MSEPLIGEAEPGVVNAYLHPESVGTKVITTDAGELLVGVWFRLDNHRFVIGLEAKDAEAWAWQMLDAIDQAAKGKTA